MNQSNYIPGNAYSLTEDERKELKKEQKREKKSWNDLIRRAKSKQALIEEKTLNQ